MSSYPHRAIQTITNVPAVKTIMDDIGHTQYEREKLPKEILDSIEAFGPLLDDDVIFANPKLVEAIKNSR